MSSHGIITVVVDDADQPRVRDSVEKHEGVDGFEIGGGRVFVRIAGESSTVAERCLATALAIRDALGPAARPGIACSLSDDAHFDFATRDRLAAWADERAPHIAVTRAFFGLRSDYELVPVPGSTFARYALTPSPSPVLAPLGRRVAPAGTREANDCEHGLLVRPPTQAVDIASLVCWRHGAPRRILVIADAWAGKTYVADMLGDALRAAGASVDLVRLEEPAAPRPDGGRTGRRVCILDSADEAFHLGLPIDAIHVPRDDELLVLVFCRDDDAREHVEAKLEPDAVFELLPIGEDELLDLSKRDASRADRARSTASKLVRGPNAALAPAEWLWILERADAPELDRRELRRDLLRQRCSRPRGKTPVNQPPESMLAAAQILAAVAAFSGQRTMHFGLDHQTGFPAADVLPSHLWLPARELTQTRVFVRRDGGYRFAALHLEEELAALAIEDALHGGDHTLDTSGLRYLFSDGRFLRAAVARVWRIVLENELPAHVTRVDVEAMRSADALVRFRALERDARQRPDQPLRAPGADMLRAIGCDAVKTRVRELLASPAASPALAYLALRTANENRWTDLASTGLRCASTATQSHMVGSIAVTLVLHAASTGATDVPWNELRELASTLRARIRGTEGDEGTLRWSSELTDAIEQLDRAQDDHDETAELLAHIALGLLRHGQESVLGIARRLPRAAYRGSMGRHGLLPSMRERLSLDEARLVVDALEQADPSLPNQIVRTLANRASTMVLDALPSPLGQSDTRRVVAIAKRYALASREVNDRLRQITSERADVRRAIFTAWDLEAGRDHTALKASPEELDWLLSLPAAKSAQWPEMLTEWVVRLALWLEHSDPASSARALEALSGQGLVERLARTRARWAEFRAQQERFAAEELERRRSERAEVRIEEWIERPPTSTDSAQRLRTLSRGLFPLAHDRRRIAGAFEDLGQDAQQVAIQKVIDALLAATPSAFARDNTISTAVLYESAAFAHAVTFSGGAWLTPDLIKHWLPGALRGSDERRDEVIEVCFAVAPRLTVEAVIADLELNAVALGHAETHYVPDSLWATSEFLSSLLDLLRQLARTGEGRAFEAVPQLFESLLSHSSTWRSAPHARSLADELSKLSAGALRSAIVSRWFKLAPDDAVDSLVAAATPGDGEG